MAVYEDFELLFINNGGTPTVRVEYREGSATAPLQLGELLSDLAGMYRRLRLHAEAGRASEASRDLDPIGAHGDTVDPDALGALLYETLFTGKIAELLAAARDRPDGGVVCLELKHELSDPVLASVAALPWELLRDPVANSRLALAPEFTIVRHVDVSRPLRLRPFAPPVRILFAMADAPDLDLEAERVAVQQQLSAVGAAIEADFEHVESLTDLSAMLRRRDYHVLHFMGHGTFENGVGGLLLGNGICQATELAPVLAHALVRLVVLNACRTAEIAPTPGANAFAGVATALVQQGVPAVLAMQLPVLDDAAALFSREFYAELARSRPIEQALSAARISLWSEYRNAAIAATPVLFQRGRVQVASPVDTPPAVQRGAVRNLEDVQDDDLLFYMMDRKDLVEMMGLALRSQEATGVPLVAVTHGNDEACFERLVERLRMRELVPYLAGDERPPIGDYPFRWPGGRPSPAELWPRIVQAIGHKQGIIDVDRLSAHFRTLPAPPIIYGSLPPETWCGEYGLRRCLDDLVAGWAEWPRGPGCRRIIVIVNIRHARPEASTGLRRWFSRPKPSPNDGIEADLEGLAASMDGRVRVITLPALDDITVTDACDWANQFVKAPGLVGEIKALFEAHERETGQNSMSMDQASRRLSELIASMTTTRGAA